MGIQANRFEEAEVTLLHLRDLHPEDRQGDGTLALLALLYREQGKELAEKNVLVELARLNDRSLEVYQRLCELEQANANWPAVRENAYRYLSVNPLLPGGHELLATAAEKLERHDEMAKSLTATLEMNPLDPAGVHYRIATAHYRDGDKPLAKRHVLMALEQAPRYRDAQRLLLELVKRNDHPAEHVVDAENSTAETRN